MTPSAPSLSPQPRSNVPSKIKPIFFLLPLAVAAIVISQFWWPNYQRKQLLKHGIEATAQITKIESTGVLYNNEPVVDLTLQVRPMQGAPFQVKTRMMITQVNIPQFQPGALLKVRYDPADHSRVAVE